MICTLEVNMANMKRMFSVQRLPECRLAVLQLLYNGNLSAISEETTSIIDDISNAGQNIGFLFTDGVDLSEERSFCEAYQASAQKMGTVLLRALRRLYGTSIGEFKTPQTLKGTPIEPRQVIREQIDALRGGYSTHWSKLPPKAFEMLIYPSHVELGGPKFLGLSSITYKYLKHFNRFLRVRFVDNDGRPFKPEPGTNVDMIIENRIVEPLRDRITLFPEPSQQFEFLGYTLSGFKKSITV